MLDKLMADLKKQLEFAVDSEETEIDSVEMFGNNTLIVSVESGERFALMVGEVQD